MQRGCQDAVPKVCFARRLAARQRTTERYKRARMRLLALLLFITLVGVTWLHFVDQNAARRHDDGEAMYTSDGTWHGPKASNADTPLNLIILIVDTLRADCATPDAQMPGLMQLAAQGTRFTHASTPAVWTYPALASLLTGVLPDRHGVRHTAALPRLPRSFTTFPEALARGHGYTTAAFVDLELRPSRDSLLQGFEETRLGIPLRGTRDALKTWNTQRDRTRPFFALIHTFEAHEPYGEENHPHPRPPLQLSAGVQLPDLSTMTGAEVVEMNDTDWRLRRLMLLRKGTEFMRRLADYRARGFAANPDWRLAARLEAAYRKGVRWVDTELVKTVDTLRAEGLLDNTMLVITADHGESFGEHGVLAHGRSLFDELVHIPLVVIGPAPFRGGAALPTHVGLSDIMPTFFHLAGLPPLPEIDGRSILADVRAGTPGAAQISIERRDHMTDGPNHDVLLLSARTAQEKYIIAYDVIAGTVIESLFDLQRDPGERDDLLSRTGRLGAHPVSAELAVGIEAVRDRVWESADAASTYAQMGYAGAAPTLDMDRPQVPKRK